MVTRRRFLQGMAMTALGAPLARLPALGAPRAAAGGAGTAAAAGVSRHVDVFVGTGGHGHTFPGATLPFGMVQLSPDTYDAEWDACSGYHQDDGSIMGFSHTHLSGTGASDMLDVLVMPGTGEVQLQPGDREYAGTNHHSRYDAVRPSADEPRRSGPPKRGYRSRYADERARPGYYRVRLTDVEVLAELTATLRAGLHRYTFGRPGAGHLLVDLAHGYHDDPAVPCKVSGAQLKLVGRDTLVGGRVVHQWANGRHIYFAMKVSRPFARATLYSEDAPLPDGSAEAKGAHLKAALHFDDAQRAPLLVKVGLSAVDIDGALRNLEAEVPGWDFDGAQRAAAQAWEAELGRIRIDTPSEETRRVFYSALYHTLLAPTLFSDVDGRYRGMDLAVHALPPGRHNYSTYSLWDTYRALHPLFTLYQAGRVPDLVDGLVRMMAESPDGPPVWPLQGRETGCMIGYHSVAVIAEAQAKGFAGIDYARAWPLLRKRAMDDDYRGLPYYRKLGYIPSDREGEAVSKTLEYAYDDWALASLADAAGAHGDAEALRERSRNYRNVFDPKLGFVRPRAADGQWIEPFDPQAMGHGARWRDFTESNAWQATFLNQHDVYAYARLFGGMEAFERKLDALFATPAQLPPDAPPDIAGLVGQYAHGNEPGHHVAYLYAYTGAHHKTQARVRMLLETMYRAAPDGLAGNEDCGQMSAWYVLGALGLYAVDPVSANYVFGSPLLDRAELDLGGGRKLVVEAHGNGPGRPYIQSVRWNGQPWTKSWIGHAELAGGGTLAFTMGATPNKAFGAAPADRPPAFGRPAAEQLA
ncbi:GH92 family glycosyl hydrolase [Fulvimonas soli]|jgi:predicted alpha-1,2-mannosidase|uniref:Putative alpha-1,2-mannosidase n=1 Tax=Fulvimonas soli TaxID=155197 RepID=A0A316IA10_9GAMM|nr:GH92 family glycosyl hydrolase [Fulvimonas soli]PWK89666.1 putative alpha-1,2-mannosidase [Fulvimonas soli]TNY27681.1 alpha-mannosidase [Fulvimonas soli]